MSAVNSVSKRQVPGFRSEVSIELKGEQHGVTSSQSQRKAGWRARGCRSCWGLEVDEEEEKAGTKGVRAGYHAIGAEEIIVR